MKPTPEPVATALNSVQTWKHEQLVAAQKLVLATALHQFTFGPGDVDDSSIASEHRQGCLSNAYNALVAAEIIERLPMHHNDPEAGIVCGRIRNQKEGAKGRWTAAYRLRSFALATSWLARHSDGETKPETETRTQTEMVIA